MIHLLKWLDFRHCVHSFEAKIVEYDGYVGSWDLIVVKGSDIFILHRLTELNEIFCLKGPEIVQFSLCKLNSSWDNAAHFHGLTGVTDGAELHITDGDIISISRKLTMLEMKELNERQRAEHAVRMYEQQLHLLGDLERRNKELEEKFAEVFTPYTFI